jgi:hypothetical protein
VLGDVDDRVEHRRPGLVRDPVVVPEEVRRLCRDLDPLLVETNDVRREEVLEPLEVRHCPVLAQPFRIEIPELRDVRARVVADEEFRGVDAGGAREGPPDEPVRVVAAERRIARGRVWDAKVPAAHADAREDEDEPLGVRQGDRLPGGFVGERTVRDRHPQAEPARAASEERVEKRERAELGERSGFQPAHG